VLSFTDTEFGLEKEGKEIEYSVAIEALKQKPQL
jgi:hypothetical protein